MSKMQQKYNKWYFSYILSRCSHHNSHSYYSTVSIEITYYVKNNVDFVRNGKYLENKIRSKKTVYL